jgi:hypothetical protein
VKLSSLQGPFLPVSLLPVPSWPDLSLPQPFSWLVLWWLQLAVPSLALWQGS